MKSQETDIRDHDTDTGAYHAELKRSRAANAQKQADEMVRVFGRDRIDPDSDNPSAGGNGWSVKDVLNDQAD